MPAKTEKQRRFMGAELERKREGKKTQTGMSEKQLEDFASKGGAKKKSSQTNVRRPGFRSKVREDGHRTVRDASGCLTSPLARTFGIGFRRIRPLPARSAVRRSVGPDI